MLHFEKKNNALGKSGWDTKANKLLDLYKSYENPNAIPVQRSHNAVFNNLAN